MKHTVGCEKLAKTEQRFWRKALVHVDEETPVLAYVSDFHWNGWECPVFTKENALRVVEQIDDPSFIEYDEDKDVFIEHDSEGDIVKGPETYMTEDGPMTVYDIGECWTWMCLRPEVLVASLTALPTHFFMGVSESIVRDALIDLAEESQLVATAGALGHLSPQEMGLIVWCHTHGIWTDIPNGMCDEDIECNEEGIREHGDVLSVWHIRGKKVYVKTDYGWEYTTVLLPEEN